MFSYPTVFVSQNQSNKEILSDINSLNQNIQWTLNKISGIEIFALTLTAIAIVEWTELFVGWPEEVTTAVLVADWTTVGFVWTYHAQILNPMKNIVLSSEYDTFKVIKYTSSIIKAQQTTKKTVKTYRKLLKYLKKWLIE